MSWHTAHLASPQVHKAITNALRRYRVPSSEVGDLRQVVLAQALATQSTPATPGEWEALVRKIARDVAFDYFRRRSARGKHDAGPCDNPDEHAAHAGEEDPIDVQEQIAHLRRDIEEGRLTPRQAEILRRVGDGMAQTEIAQELGLAHQTVRNELHAARKTVRRSWAAYAAAATVLCGIALLLWIPRRTEAPLGSMPKDSSGHPTPAVVPDAGALRRMAIDARDRRAWDDCLKDLDRAAAKDPEGDRAGAVQALRGECARGSAASGRDR